MIPERGIFRFLLSSVAEELHGSIGHSLLKVNPAERVHKAGLLWRLLHRQLGEFQRLIQVSARLAKQVGDIVQRIRIIRTRRSPAAGKSPESHPIFPASHSVPAKENVT